MFITAVAVPYAKTMMPVVPHELHLPLTPGQSVTDAHCLMHASHQIVPRLCFIQTRLVIALLLAMFTQKLDLSSVTVV